MKRERLDESIFPHEECWASKWWNIINDSHSAFLGGTLKESRDEMSWLCAREEAFEPCGKWLCVHSFFPLADRAAFNISSKLLASEIIGQKGIGDVGKRICHQFNLSAFEVYWIRFFIFDSDINWDAKRIRICVTDFIAYAHECDPSSWFTC